MEWDSGARWIAALARDLRFRSRAIITVPVPNAMPLRHDGKF